MQTDPNDPYLEPLIRQLAESGASPHLTGDQLRRILRKAQQLIVADETAQDLKSKRHTRQNTQARLRVIAHEPNEKSDPERFRDTDEYYEELIRVETSKRNPNE